MAQDLDLQIKIRALVEGINQVKGLSDEVARLGQSGKRPIGDPTAQLRNGAQRARGAVGGLTSDVLSLKGALAGLGVSFALRELTRAADTYQLMRGRLALVTASTEELIAVEKRLFETAQRTRSGYEDTGRLYSRLAQQSKSLGTSQDDLLRLTEGINQAFQISGATTAEAAGSVIQFTQLIATGARGAGQEIQSVSEQAPRLIKAITDGLEQIGVGTNITLADLRKMAENTELNTGMLVKALLTQVGALEREYENIPRVVGGAMAQLANDVQRALAQADMTPLIEAIDGVRDILTDPATLEAIKLFGTTFAQAINLALIPARELGQFLRWIRTQKDVAMPLPELAASGDPERLQARIAAVRQQIDSLQALQRMRGPLDGEKERMDVWRQEILTLERLRQAHSRRLAGETGVDLTIKPPAAPERPVEDKAARARLGLAKATADAELTIQQDMLERQQAGYERALEDRLISVREYYDRKTQIDLAQLDAEIARQTQVLDAARGVAASAADEGDRLRAMAELAGAEADLTVLINRRGEVQIENSRAAAAAERELRGELDKTRESLLELQSQIVGGSPQLDLELALVRVETEYQRILDVAKQLEGVDRQRAEQLAGQWQALARQAAVVQAQGEVARKLADAQQAAEGVTRAGIDAGQASGALTDLEALRATGEANRVVLEQLGQIRDAYLAMGEAGATAAAQVQAQMIVLSTQLHPVADEIRGIFGSALSGFFESFAGESQSWKDRFLGLAEEIVSELQRMFSQELAQQLLKGLSGLFGGQQAQAATAAAAAMISGATTAAAILAAAGAAGGGGGGGGAGASLLAGLFHTGGMVGQAGAQRRLPAVYMATAPRYHNGLLPGEVPAILAGPGHPKGPEMVLNRDQQRQVFGGGGGISGGGGAPPQFTVKNINLFDNQVIGDYLSTGAGEKLVLNIVSRNKSALGIA